MYSKQIRTSRRKSACGGEDEIATQERNGPSERPGKEADRNSDPGKERNEIVPQERSGPKLAVFNRSSQHLMMEVLSADSESAKTSAGVSGADPLAWSPDGGVAGGPSAVLDGDRCGLEDPRRRRRRRRVRARRLSLVPARWRSESAFGPDHVGAVSVLKQPRRNRALAGPGLRSARDRPPVRPEPVNGLS